MPPGERGCTTTSLILKMLTLGPGDLTISLNPPSWRMVTDLVGAGQVQGFLDEVNYLDPFQFGLKSRYKTETHLIALMDDLHWETDGGVPPTLTLLLVLGLEGAYLEERFLKVELSDHSWIPWPLASPTGLHLKAVDGVTQRSGLGCHQIQMTFSSLICFQLALGRLQKSLTSPRKQF